VDAELYELLTELGRRGYLVPATRWVTMGRRLWPLCWTGVVVRTW
jgi:hypothetical protein